LLKTIWSHPPGSNRRPADYEFACAPYIVDSLCGADVFARHFTTYKAKTAHKVAHESRNELFSFNPDVEIAGDPDDA
jgi:hypothetical protein